MYSNSELKKIKIWKHLPYKSSYILIDKVLEFEKDSYIKCMKYLSHTESIWVESHFPDNPIMPGALIAEAMSQASALLANLSSETDEMNKIGVICKFDLSFYHKAVPGDILDIIVKRQADVCGLVKSYVEASVDGVIYSKGTITGAMVDKDDN